MQFTPIYLNLFIIPKEYCNTQSYQLLSNVVKYNIKFSFILKQKLGLF